jgi:hypothetical protein
METYRKPAIAGVHLEFADGINVFPSREIGFHHRTTTTRGGKDPEYLRAHPAV